MMNSIYTRFLSVALMLGMFVACDSKVDPDTPITPKPNPGTGTGTGTTPTDPYADLSIYQPLKNYVDRQAYPSFILGVAVDGQQSKLYDLAGANFDEMTPGNAMKYGSVVRSDGTMNFSGVNTFLTMAQSRGLSVYGHTLAWHSQQQPAYLNSLIQDTYVELPGDTGEYVIVEADFNDGKHPFIGWGNSSTLAVADGALKLTNPSALQSWEVQFAYDSPQAFVNGQEYRLTFRIKGSASGTLGAGLQIIDGYKSAVSCLWSKIYRLFSIRHFARYSYSSCTMPFGIY